MSDLDALCIELTERTAARLEAEGRVNGWPRINERITLQPACAAEAGELAVRSGRQVAPAPSHRIELVYWQPGFVDVPLVIEGSQRVMLELKCGEGRDALGSCAWDAAKCASALRDGAVDAAYLLAGVPTTNWEKPIRGADFFSTREW